MTVQHVQQIGWVDGKPVILTAQQYRVLYYVSIHFVVHFHVDSSGHGCDGWKLTNGEPVTSTTKSLVHRGYLKKADGGVHLTDLGRQAMVKYWNKRKESGAVSEDLRQED